MLHDKTLAVVVPAHNEATQIERVIRTMPDTVDRIVVVDDASTDDTAAKVQELQGQDPRLHLIRHSENQGVGAAISTGYKYCRDAAVDVVVVMAGDAQMDPADLPAVAAPVALGEVDYCKGNRLFTGEAYRKIPRVRYFGNALLSLLTKVASGYWHVADSQTGYTVINLRALEMLNLDGIYKRYGMPNDLLVKLNIYNFRVRDIPVKPIYNIGEKSLIKIRKVMITLSWLLLKDFIYRLKEKYIIRDFHPLVFFYLSGLTFTVATIVLFIRLFWYWYAVGHIPPINALAAMFSFMSAIQFTLFAMWFDMQNNKDLK